MLYFLLGLVGFLAVHSIRIVAPRWREARIAAIGEGAWKGIYSLVSIGLFVLLVWGYGQARLHPELLWLPPVAMRHIGALLVLVAFILVVAAFVPGNAIRARLGHPMMLGIKVWALAHLLMVGWLHAAILFAAFLVWAILGFRSARRRPSVSAGPTRLVPTLMTLVLGAAAWAGFAFWAHVRWIGVAPFG